MCLTEGIHYNQISSSSQISGAVYNDVMRYRRYLWCHMVEMIKNVDIEDR